jgi:hypothetical protein
MRPNVIHIEIENGPKVVHGFLVVSQSAPREPAEEEAFYAPPSLKSVLKEEEVGQGGRKVVDLRA